MIIREFTERDIEEITQLMKNLCKIKSQIFDEDRWRSSLENHMRKNTNSEVMVALDKNDNQVLGMANCSIEKSDNGQRFGYLSNLIVREEKRRSGIGEALIHHAIDYFKRNHIESIRLALKSDINKAAEKLFTKVGFKPLYEVWSMKI